MAKRFIARLLIVLQIYGNLFQGVAHAATLVDENNYRPILNRGGELGIEQSQQPKNFEDIHISAFTHLYSAINELGELQFALGDGFKSPRIFTIPTLDNPADSFEYGGVTVTSHKTYFTFQGLNVSIKNTGLNAGVMEVNGNQTCQSKPIFLSSNRPIIFNDVKADVLQIISPQVVTNGISTIDYLMLEKSDTIDGWGAPQLSFINGGNLTAKKLFLNNLNGNNQGTLLAASLGVIGELESSGVIEVGELALGENALVKLDEDSRADIKTLFLSKSSRFENQQQADSVLHIGFLAGSGGSITNLGALIVGEIAVDSTLQAINNRHLLSFGKGVVNTQEFINNGTLVAEQSELWVSDGQNSGLLKAQSLRTDKEFTNNTSGVMDIPLVSGSGHLYNLGKIAPQDTLDVDIKRFTNKGEVRAITFTGLAGLQRLINAEEAHIEMAKALGFEQTTVVINQGNMLAKAMALFASKTTQKGHITTTILNLLGGGDFENLGDIDVEQDLNLERLDSFINKGELSTKLINGYENLITLKNDSGALFKVRDGPLDLLATTTNLINAGTIAAQSLDLNSDHTTLLKSGIFKAPSISLTGVSSFTNSGQIIADHLIATNELVNHGQLMAQQSATLAKGLTITAKGFTLLRDLKIGEAVTNHGELQIVGIQPNQGIINLTNSGTASIDGCQILPKASEHSPENLARVATSVEPLTWHSAMVDAEFDGYDPITHKRTGSRYLSLFKALSITGPYNPVFIEPEFYGLNPILVKRQATRYKRDFEKLYTDLVKRSLTEGTTTEQAELQHYLQPFESHYQVIQDKRQQLINTASLVTGAAMVVENSTLPTVKLQLENQTTGELTLKSGRFEFKGDKGLVNDGLLTQEDAYTLWLAGAVEFNRGVWQAKGSLGLLGYNGSKLGNLMVTENLHVQTAMEGLRALDGLSKVQARKVILQANYVQNQPLLLERVTKQYPWPLEMTIIGGIDNNVDISAPELKVKAQSLKTSGNLFSNQAALELEVAGDAEISASIGGQAGINLSAKKLKLLGRADIPGAVIPNVCYKRNENGLYAQGPVVLNIADLVDNQYGVIQGSSYTIKAPQLINLAGLITATDPSLSSIINVKEIKNLRDEAKGYTTYSRQQRIYYSGGKDWCGCCGTRVSYCGNGAWMNIPIANSYETSDEGVIFAQGDLTLNYHQLEMLASRITSGGKLTLESGDKQLAYANAPDIKILPGTTTMTVRNGHGNHVVAKQDLHVELGNANMATSMQANNIFVNAGMLTLQSLGLQNKSQGKIVNLLSLMQGNSFKKISSGDSSNYTDLTLPFKHQHLPTSLVILGQDARCQLAHTDGVAGNQSIDLQATMRSLEQAMGSQFYTLYRGIDGLGLDINHFFKATSDFVSGHKDTVTQRRSIKSGETEQEVDVQLNPTLTSQDLLDSGILGVFLDFTKNIQGLESTHKALDDVNQTKQKSALMFAVPTDSKKNPGLTSPGVIEVTSKGDLGVFTNVKGKDVKLVSTDGSTTVGSKTLRHQLGHNYHDQLIRTRIEATENLLIKGKTDVVLKAIETHSGVKTDIIAEMGMILDESLATVDHTVSYSYDDESSTTTKITNVHQNVSSHSSGGKVHIKANTGILQYGAKNINANLDAPIIIQDDVHDQRMVESQTISLNSGGGFGGFFGIKERKETNFSENISRSKGCHNSGEKFIAMAKERFKAVNPTFSAKHNEITADEIELKVGTNTHQFYTQSSYQGPVWNKISQSTENHITHRNPTFEHNIYLHSPSIILERVKGSIGTGAFDKVISDSKVQFKDVDDTHQSTHKSQKSLSAGASLILSLAVTLATGNPFTASSLSAAMLGAGYGTLCSQAAICLVEKDGDPGKAINELGRRDIGKAMFMSMATAGLTKGLGDKLGITNSIGFENLVKKHLLQSAINTSMAVAIDGQNFEKAMLQGVTSAAINTLAAYGAGKIGDLRDQSNPDRINFATHKLLHGALGGISGGISSQLSGGKFARGALSGAFGGVMGESLAELTGNKQVADLLATAIALGTGLDPITAYQTSHNATEYNYLAHRPCLETLGIIEEEIYEEEEQPKGLGSRQKTQKQDRKEKGNFFSKSLSPKRPTWLQTEVIEPVKEFISSVAPDKIKRTLKQAEESLGKKAEKSSNAWQDFKQNPSIDNWSTKHALRHGAFETLGALGTGVEYVKAYGRRGLRGMGMDANHAQDTMSVLDGLTMVGGGTKAVTGIASLSKQTLVSGTKLTNKLSEMTKGSGPRIKAYVKDQFNYREHFAAERLRLEGGGLNLPKAGKYFDAEDVGVKLGIQIKDGMNKRDCNRKIETFNQAIKDKKLISNIPHGISSQERQSLTRSYRKGLIKRIDNLYKNNPTAHRNALERLNASDIDHMIDLQLLGQNSVNNLRAMHSFTNQELGRQISRQLPKGEKKLIKEINIIQEVKND